MINTATLSRLVIGRWRRWRFNQLDDVVLVIAEHAVEVRLRLIGDAFTDRLTTAVDRVLDVPDLGHRTASPADTVVVVVTTS